MRGRFVQLRLPTDEDYVLLTRWLTFGSRTAVMTNDAGYNHTPARLKDMVERGDCRIFMIQARNESTVGMVSYSTFQQPKDCYEMTGAVGDPQLWQAGYAAEAGALLLAHLFHYRGARRVECTTAMYNKNIIRTLSSAGFVLEGILREQFYLDGQYHDAVVWSMLRRDFYAAVDGQLGKVFEQLRDLDEVPSEDKIAAREAVVDHLRDKGRASTLRDFLTGSGGADETVGGHLLQGRSGVLRQPEPMSG